MGRPVWAVARDAPADAAARHAAAHPGGMYWTRVAAADAARAGDLVAHGWRPVDVAITLDRPPLPAAGDPGMEIEDAGPDQREAVVGIAGLAFRVTRFHLDPQVPDGAADAVKRAWAGNCVDGIRGSGVRVAVRDGGVAGFLAVIATGDGTRAIDLVAVHPAHQGTGVGRALVRDFILREGPAARRLAVGTQAANVASIRLYEECGFRVAAAEYVLHLHA